MYTYLIDPEGLLNLQKLHDLFFFEYIGGQKSYIKKLGDCYVSLQSNTKYRTKVFSLYNEVFTAFRPEHFQGIIYRTNQLLSELIIRFGDFTSDEAFNEIDSFDKATLLEIIMS